MSNIGNLDVEVEAIKDAASGLQEDVTHMRGALSNMEFYVRNLNNYWKSNNYTTFSKAFLENMEKTIAIYTDLLNVLNALKSTTEIYGEFEQQLIEDAAKIK